MLTFFYPPQLQSTKTIAKWYNITQYLYSSHSPDCAKGLKVSQVRILGIILKKENVVYVKLSFVFWLVKMYSNTTHLNV